MFSGWLYLYFTDQTEKRTRTRFKDLQSAPLTKGRAAGTVAYNSDKTAGIVKIEWRDS